MKTLEERFEEKFPASEVVNDDDEPIRSFYTRIRVKRFIKEEIIRHLEMVKLKECVCGSTMCLKDEAIVELSNKIEEIKKDL
jgi:hypothetical protein